MSKPVAEGSVLGPFSSYLAEYKKLLAASVALGAAPALTELVLGIGPPWPHRRGIILLTSLVAWVVLIWSFSAWRHTARKFLVSRVTACAILAGASLVVYLLLQAFFVDDAPDSPNQEAMGFLVRPQIQRVLAEEPENDAQGPLEGRRVRPDGGLDSLDRLSRSVRADLPVDGVLRRTLPGGFGVPAPSGAARRGAG
jgi:hypothetical protein